MMHRRFGLLLGQYCFIGWWYLLIGAGSGWADDPLQFNRDIRPILAEYCLPCHGPDSAARESGLRLDVREEAIDFEAIVPGDPDASGLIARIYSEDSELAMPPAEAVKQLSLDQKEVLRKWIAQGAEYQPHWAFSVPERSELPEIQDTEWVKNPVDYFVLSALENHGLTPAPAADPRTLFRRLHLDITGLPPQPEDIASFEADYQARHDEALEVWIDKLMAIPAWGEHRARYWLDAARYGDTHGMHFDNYREMWPYRDWVIRAFNANQPFDQFIIEQLAGDLLPDPTTDQLIATGFQRCNITTNEGGTIEEENLALYASDRVQTLGWVFLGLTTNCSQCHDHKFDPISIKDYYALAAFFRNTTQSGLDGNVKDGRSATISIPSAEDQRRWESLPKEIATAQASRDRRRADCEADYETWLTSLRADAIAQQLSTEGLLVHAMLNEGSGNEVDITGQNSSTLRSAGEVQWTPDGKIGHAPVFTTGSTFEVGDAGDWDLVQPFSYGAWVKTASSSGSGGIIARMDEQSAYRGWDLWQNGNAYAVHLIDMWPENAIKVTTGDNTVKPGQWQHVFVTYDGSGKLDGIKIFLDGQATPLTTETHTLQPNASIRTPTPTRIGQRSHQQVFENGSLQDVRLYNRRLLEDEVTAIFADGLLAMYMMTPPDEWTSEVNAAVLDYYLANVDSEFQRLVEGVSKLEAEYTAIRERSPITHIQQEKPDSQPMAHILMRGEYDQKGDQVEAATPAALHPLQPDLPRNRLGLAQWLVDPANPLTSRVTVNRFWQQVFGEGLVVTVEDFGVMGAPPSHPELLDWLAVEFRENGWDVQQLHKLFFMSATYRQAAITTPKKLELDRHNALLSRGPRFRMDAEMIRDLALSVSNLLSQKMYGPGVRPYQPENIWDVVGLPEGNTRNYVQDTGEDLYRRTIYTFWKRMAPPPNLDIFNAPSREVCSVKRERTNTPLQALVTLNDPLFVEAARNLAQTALDFSRKNVDEGDRLSILDFVALRVLNRTLTQGEINSLLADLQEFLAYYQANPDDARALISVGDSMADEQFDVAELAAWTMVCNQVLNLDEAINK